MRRSFAIVAAASLLALAIVATAIAGASKMKADPVKYDPDRTGIIVAAWQAKAGLPDAGNSNHGLVLQKNGPTPTNAAAFAVVTGAEGQAITGGANWGWDYKNGSYCGAGAPRFNVQASDGFHFGGGCANGDPVVGAPAGWTRVRFDTTTDFFPPLTTGATIQSVDIAFDEQGQGLIDNIVVNGNNPIEKPGNN
jgi:hypothetical protein